MVKTIVKIGEYKGNATMSFVDVDDNGNEKPYPFTIGVKKCKTILEHIEDIKKFVEENSKSK